METKIDKPDYTYLIQKYQHARNNTLDLNTLTTPGQYLVGITDQTVQHSPVSNGNFLNIITYSIDNNSDYMVQKAIAGNGHYTYSRYMSSGIWYDWQRLPIMSDIKSMTVGTMPAGVVGWHHIGECKFTSESVSQGAYGFSCLVKVSSRYNNNSNNSCIFIVNVAFNLVRLTMLSCAKTSDTFTKVRLSTDGGYYKYIDIYYTANAANEIDVTIYNLTQFEFKAMCDARIATTTLWGSELALS